MFPVLSLFRFIEWKSQIKTFQLFDSCSMQTSCACCIFFGGRGQRYAKDLIALYIFILQAIIQSTMPTIISSCKLLLRNTSDESLTVLLVFYNTYAHETHTVQTVIMVITFYLWDILFINFKRLSGSLN